MLDQIESFLRRSGTSEKRLAIRVIKITIGVLTCLLNEWSVQNGIKIMSDTQYGKKRYVYFYFNRNEPEKIRHVVPAHVQYWKTANLEGYMGGPFGDRTGGLISFVAPNLQGATEIILEDPFIVEDLISEKWIKEWILE